jgi:lipopolysaccharide heptosyltransferase II
MGNQKNISADCPFNPVGKLKTINRILVIRTDRIGDVILSLPVVTALRRRYPNARLAMLVQPAVLEIVEDHPDLNDILLDGREHEGARGFFQLAKEIRKSKFDAALLLHPTLRLAFLLACAKIPVRVGTGYRYYSFLFNRKVWEHRSRGLRHETEYNLSLAAKLDADVSQVDFRVSAPEHVLKWADHQFKSMGIQKSRPLVVLHPGSRGSALDWAAGRFAELADRLVEEVNAQVILTGGREEKDVIAKIFKGQEKSFFNLVGLMNLKELAAVLKKADLVVANSTGPLHLASVLGTEVVGLYPPFAPASARRWGPYGRKDGIITPKIPECRRCSREKCPRWNCMDLIPVEEVLQLVMKKLNHMGYS